MRGTRLLVADDQHHRLVVFDTGGHLLTRGRHRPGSGPGQLNFPYGVAIDRAGRVFVADDLNHRVVRFSSAPTVPVQGPLGLLRHGAGPARLSARPRGRTPTATSTSPTPATTASTSSTRGGALLRSFGASGRAAGQFDEPARRRRRRRGIRAVTDSVNGRVAAPQPRRRRSPPSGARPRPGPTILPDPVAVAFDAAGNAYVLDQRRSRIVVFSRATGCRCARSARRAAAPASCSSRSALAIDAGGDDLVADTGNERIARFGDRRRATSARPPASATARGIAVTPDGSAHVRRDRQPAASRVYDPIGARARRVRRPGNKLGKLESPGQIALDAAGNLWVADRGNNRVQQFGPDGERLLAFGTRGVGPGEFIHPTGVSVDCRGTLTVTDTDNNRVQQFALAAPAGRRRARALGRARQPAAAQAADAAGARSARSSSVRVLRTTGLLIDARRCRCASAATPPAR